MPALDLNSYFGTRTATASTGASSADTAAAIDKNPAQLWSVLGIALFVVFLVTRK